MNNLGRSELNSVPDYVLKKRMEDQMNSGQMEPSPRAISEVLERMSSMRSRLRVAESLLRCTVSRAFGEFPPTGVGVDDAREPTCAVDALLRELDLQQSVMSELEQHLERLERFV